jgi:hypothetical protein
MSLKDYQKWHTDDARWYCGNCAAPCTMCQDPVLNGQRGMDCDKCGSWTHSQCGGLSNNEYDRLIGTTFAYTCPHCDYLNINVDSSDTSSCSSSEANSSLGSSSHETGDDTNREQPTSCAAPRRKKQNNLKFLTINFQSIKNKIAELNAIVDEYQPDIIVGTETWLNSNILNAEIVPQGYMIHRRDRKADSHGGVILIYKKEMAVTRKTELETEGENIWCQVNIQGRRPIIFGVIYKPKHGDLPPIEGMKASIDIINARPKTSDIIVTGDFNQGNIEWETNTINKEHYASKVAAARLLDFSTQYNMQQMVKEATRDNSILDLVFTNNTNIINQTKVEPGVGDHEMVVTELNLVIKRPKQPRRRIYLRKKADEEGIRKDMCEYQKTYADLGSVTVQEKWNHLEKEIKRTMDEHVPSKVKSNRRNLPWFDRSNRRRSRKKQRLYNKAKKSGSPEDWKVYRDYNKECRRALNKSRWDYIHNELGSSVKEDPKSFWTFINSLRKENNGVADLKVDNRLLTDSKDKAEALNNQFCSVFTQEDKTYIPTLGQSNMADIPELVIGEEGVRKQLLNLKPNKAPGPDGIFPWMLKMMANELTPILTKLFQQSIADGYLPSQWRQADICPIFKKGDRAKPSNYRPVSLTSVVCKILEHIVHSHIMDHLEKHNILVDNQHGFRAKHSTETQLILTVNDLAKNLENGDTVHVAILDFEKAFDKVPHERLLSKLDFYGIRGNLHKWIRHFLTERTQRVVCDGVMSETKKVVSSVPQGTVTGPLDFLIYINDLPDNLSNKARLFADDCVIYTAAKSQQDLQSLQEDLKKLEVWQKTWGMSFNASKCFIMKISNKRNPPDRDYTFCNQKLQEVQSHPYLGIEIDNKLNWNMHRKNTVTKANRVLGCLRRNLWFCTKEVKETAYMALVRPILEYASSAWGPYQEGHINQLEAVQRKAARFCMGDYKQKSSVTKMISELKWDSLETRRRRTRLTMMYKITNDLVGINKMDHLIHITNSRTRKNNNSNFQQIHARLNIYKFSYFPRTIKEWNALGEEQVTATTTENFKGQLCTSKAAAHRHR